MLETMVARETRPDGRLVPVDGDAVYCNVPGPFGTAASIKGIVKRGRREGSALRVKITGAASMFGGRTTSKTVALDPRWTVVGDPAIENSRKARESAEAERKAKYLRETEEREARIAAAFETAIAGGATVITVENATPGMRVFHYDYEEPATITEIAGDEIYLRHDSDPATQAGGFAGWTPKLTLITNA